METIEIWGRGGEGDKGRREREIKRGKKKQKEGIENVIQFLTESYQEDY